MIVKKYICAFLCEWSYLWNFYAFVLFFSVEIKIERFVGLIDKVANKVGVLDEMEEKVKLFWI